MRKTSQTSMIAERRQGCKGRLVYEFEQDLGVGNRDDISIFSIITIAWLVNGRKRTSKMHGS